LVVGSRALPTPMGAPRLLWILLVGEKGRSSRTPFASARRRCRLPTASARLSTVVGEGAREREEGWPRSPSRTSVGAAGAISRARGSPCQSASRGGAPAAEEPPTAGKKRGRRRSRIYRGGGAGALRARPLHEAMAAGPARAPMDLPTERSSRRPLLLLRGRALEVAATAEAPPVPHPAKASLEAVRRGGMLLRSTEVSTSCCSRWVSSRSAAEAACAGGAAPPPSPTRTIKGGRPPLTLPRPARGSW
jgi:hypothetical protein